MPLNATGDGDERIRCTRAMNCAGPFETLNVSADDPGSWDDFQLIK